MLNVEVIGERCLYKYVHVGGVTGQSSLLNKGYIVMEQKVIFARDFRGWFSNTWIRLDQKLRRTRY